MIFSIKRASGTWKNCGQKPCPEAVQVLPPDGYNEGLYTIEFKTIEELMAFVQRERSVVLYKDGKQHLFSSDTLYKEAIANMPDGLVMIYDAYLE